jgi:hypothetical protein
MLFSGILNSVNSASFSADATLEALNSTTKRVFTTDEEQAQAQAVLEKLRQNSDVFQDELNGISNVGSSMFVAGWRPTIGWICAAAMAVYYIPRFIAGTILWCIAAWGQPSLPPLPEMGVSDLLGLVGTLLGMSWFRTDEKKAGIAK